MKTLFVLLATISATMTSPCLAANHEVFQVSCSKICTLDMDGSKFCEHSNSKNRMDTLVFFTSNLGEHIELSVAPYKNIAKTLKGLPSKVVEEIERNPWHLQCEAGRIVEVTALPAFGSQL